MYPNTIPTDFGGKKQSHIIYSFSTRPKSWDSGLFCITMVYFTPNPPAAEDGPVWTHVYHEVAVWIVTYPRLLNVDCGCSHLDRLMTALAKKKIMLKYHLLYSGQLYLDVTGLKLQLFCN